LTVTPPLTLPVIGVPLFQSCVCAMDEAVAPLVLVVGVVVVLAAQVTLPLVVTVHCAKPTVVLAINAASAMTIRRATLGMFDIVPP
jgi:hypothetical protein